MEMDLNEALDSMTEEQLADTLATIHKNIREMLTPAEIDFRAHAIAGYVQESERGKPDGPIIIPTRHAIEMAIVADNIVSPIEDELRALYAEHPTAALQNAYIAGRQHGAEDRRLHDVASYTN